RIPRLLPLLCLRLCAGQGSRGTDEPLPKPTLRAWPSWVVPPRSSVRLRCQTPTKDVDFVLKKGNVVLDVSRSPASKEGLAEFHLTGLRTSHAGDYTCECYRPGAPDIRSPPSEVILLLVTVPPGAISRDYTTGNLIRLGLASLVVVIMGALLLEAWCSQKESPRG
uniref:Immunoglobulin domain-containing protein n=1 Tax=Panthera tigris altaica TaxID=74533 RepID=A0A8C9JG73_PANTA